jgi:hypothetical protein
MAAYIPIPGTWALFSDTGQPDWWQAGSPFTTHMRSQDFRLLRPDNPFVWSTQINGHKFWTRWFGGRDTKDHADWKAGGAALRYYVDHGPCPRCGWHEVPVRHRNILAHSHGLQVVLYACADGLRIRRLVSFGSPIRSDMRAVAMKALPNIDRWMHVYDPTCEDRIQWLGQFGDGVIDLHPDRTVDLQNVVNHPIRGVGHSELLCDPRQFHHLAPIIAFLK